MMLTQKSAEKLKVTQRATLGVKIHDKVTNIELRHRAKMSDVDSITRLK